MSQLEVAMLKGIVAAHGRWNQPFKEAEWRAFVDPLRKQLRTVKDAGGDADYVLFVLSSFRWRFMVSGQQTDLDQCRELLKTIEGIAARNGVLWKKFRQELRELTEGVEGLLFGRTFFRDASPFDEMLGEGDGIRSRLTYRALVALDDHFRKAIAPRRLNHEELLRDIVDASAMRSWNEDARKGRQAASQGPAESFSTLDWVHKRLQRAPSQLRAPVHGWIVAHSPQDMVIAYHQFHHAAGLGCGPACKVEPDWGG